MKPIKLQEDGAYGLGFAASLIDGPLVDFFDLADLERTQQLETSVWDKYSWQTLLRKCKAADLIEIDEHEGGPGMSDTFYWVVVHDLDEFRRELRELMLAA